MSNYIVVGNVVEISFFCNLAQQYSANVLHYGCTAVTGLGVTDQEFADAMSPLAAGVYKPFLASVASYLGCRTQIISPVKRPHVESDVDAGVGAVADNPLPSQAAFLIEKQTNTVTMGAFGRTFLPFWTILHDSAAGVPTTGAVTLAGSWGFALLSPQVIVGAAGTCSFDPVLWSRKYSTAKPITGFKFARAWATHKSRSQINRGDRSPL